MIYAIYSTEKNYKEDIKKLKKCLREYDTQINIDSDLYLLYLHLDNKILMTIQLESTEQLLAKCKGTPENPQNIAEKYIFDVLNDKFNVLKVHMKYKTRTLFTINGLNSLIYHHTHKTQNEIDYNKVSLPWEEYSFRFIHMTNNKLRLEKTELISKVNIIDKDYKNIIEEIENSDNLQKEILEEDNG